MSLKKYLTYFVCLFSCFVLADENILPNLDFKTMGKNNFPAGWNKSSNHGKYEFQDGVMTLSAPDGEHSTVSYQMISHLKPETQYVFQCKLQADSQTEAQVYVEGTYKKNDGKTGWYAFQTGKFAVGTAWQERTFKFIPRGDSASIYMAFRSCVGVPVRFKDIVVRATRTRPAMGGAWDLENQIEIIDNGVVATRDMPARLIGLPVEPGKVYMLKYIAEGIGDTGNDYPFHEMVVKSTPQGIQGGYFFNDVRNVPMPKMQKITIPANSNIKSISFTFNANTKGRVKFYDFSFAEYVPDPKDSWRLFLDEPYYRDIIFASSDAGVIKGTIQATAPAVKAVVTFDGTASSTAVALLDGKGTFSIPAKNLKVGKYTLKCTLQDRSGAELKSFTKSIAKVPAAKNEVICKSNRYFYVDGKPFFPVTQWTITFAKNEEALYYAAKCGINSTITSASQDADSTLRRLDSLHKFGIKVIINGGNSISLSPSHLETFRQSLEKRFPPEVRNHPAFFGYFMIDEPLWGGKSYAPLAASLEIYKEFDPYHPVWINAAPRNEVEDLIPYGEACDIYGVDIYPIPYPNSHSGLDDKGITSVGKYTSRMCDITFWRKPNWMALQGFAWAGLKRGTPLEKQVYPDYTQMRFMAFDTMFNGCNGYGLWGTQYVISPEFYETMYKTTSELQKLSGLFVNGTQLKDLATDNADVRVVPVKCNNAMYYAILNLVEKESKCTFDVENAKFTNFQEKTTLTPVNGKLSVTLGAYGTMLIGNAPLPAPTYVPPTIAALEKPGIKNTLAQEIQKEQDLYKYSTFYKGNSNWIWSKAGASNAGSAVLATKTFNVDDPNVQAKLMVAADDYSDCYVNGKLLGKTDGWSFMATYDLKGVLKKGENRILIKANDSGSLPCGILCDLQIGGKTTSVTDTTWLVKDTKLKDPLPTSFDGFEPAFIVGKYGTGAWGDKVIIKK